MGGPGVPAAIGPLLAGAATAAITIEPGAPLAGFGASPRREFTATTIPLNLLALGGTCFDPDSSTAATFFEPNKGTHDPVMARALVLSNGVHKVAVVKLDLIGTSRKLREDLFKVATTLGIAYSDFVVLATHTHSGPGAISEHTLPQLLAVDCFSDAMYQRVLLAATTALQQANAALQPARLGTASTKEDQASKNRSGQPTVYDTELGIVKITTPGGTPIAALFNFAVHGTSLGKSNLLISADCMGEMERVIEAGIPGVVAIFTNGAEGDVAPKHGDFLGMQQEGTIVGGDVVALWSSIATKSAIDLRGALQDVAMPSPSWNAGTCVPVPGTSKTLCDMIPGFPLTLPLNPAWLPTTLPFQALRIDDTVFVAIPGEPVTEIGWDLKARAVTKGFAHGFIFGLANEYGGYFATLAQYNAATYEGQATLYGPTTAQVVVDSADAVMAQVQ